MKDLKEETNSVNIELSEADYCQFAANYCNETVVSKDKIYNSKGMKF